MYEIFFDGLCEPKNPGGVASYGYVIWQDNRIIKKGCRVVGYGAGMTNNVAEYSALFRALFWLVKESKLDILHESIIVRGDSQLVINQLNGTFAVKSETSRTFVPKIQKLVRGLKITYVWIPRAENADADMLSYMAYNRFVSGKNLNELVDKVEKLEKGKA
jgi:ribonuclease HI